MGVDPATAGMLPGMPPTADAGAGGAAAGAADAGTSEPTLTLTLSQLWDVVTKVLGLAKKIGSNGQGVAAEAPQSSASSPDAIKTAVIEALSSMGAMKMAAASGAQMAQDGANRAAANNFERNLHQRLVRKAKAGAMKFDKEDESAIEKLRAMHGNKMVNWDINRGFSFR